MQRALTLSSSSLPDSQPSIPILTLRSHSCRYSAYRTCVSLSFVLPQMAPQGLGLCPFYLSGIFSAWDTASHIRGPQHSASRAEFLHSPSNLKRELLISQAEIFEDFQSLGTTSQSEEFKEWIYRPAYSALKSHLHFSRERPEERLITGELSPLHRLSDIGGEDLPLARTLEHTSTVSMKPALPMGIWCTQLLLLQQGTVWHENSKAGLHPWVPCGKA